MKRIYSIPLMAGLLASVIPSLAQSTLYAPANFSDLILTSTPSNATGSSGISTVYSTSGQQLTFGTGGSLINPAQFDYTVTGPNTATLTTPASGSSAATTTNLVFNGQSSGTYTTTEGSDTTTGSFKLAEIPFSAPISNVSVRSSLSAGGSTTVGFVVAGTMPRRVLIRAVGPGLSALGVQNPLGNPSLTLYSGTQAIATNNDWGTSSGGVLATGGAMPGTTSTSMSSGTSSSSTSTMTGSTSNTGSTSSGSTSGTGSTTATSSVAGTTNGTLPNGGSFNTQLATTATFDQVGAFPLTAGSADAALVVDLPPGPYTVMVSGSGATTATTGVVGPVTSSGTLSTGVTTGSSSSTLLGNATLGTSLGGNTTGPTSAGTGTSTSTGSATATSPTSGISTGSASGEVLVEVYFIQ